jgi:hypothetical protein
MVLRAVCAPRRVRPRHFALRVAPAALLVTTRPIHQPPCPTPARHSASLRSVCARAPARRRAPRTAGCATGTARERSRASTARRARAAVRDAVRAALAGRSDCRPGSQTCTASRHARPPLAGRRAECAATQPSLPAAPSRFLAVPVSPRAQSAASSALRGILLWVEWMDGPAVGGIWRAAGIVKGDSGTWTAKLVREPRL